MKYLLTGVIALTLLTACGQKDKAGGGATPASVVYSAADLPNVSLRKGDAATAGAALDALSLGASGAGRLNFDGKDLSGDKATFTNVTLSLPQGVNPAAAALLPGLSDADIAGMFAMMDADGDGLADDGSGLTLEQFADEMAPASEPSTPDLPPVIKAARMEFDGLGVFDGQASFARMKLSDITITPAEGSEDQSNGKIASIELINPSPQTAAWVASLLGKGDPAPFPEGTALAFDRWTVGGVNFSIADGSGTGTLTMDSMHISSLAEEKAGLAGLSNLRFDFSEASGQDINISLEGLGIRGINYGLFSDAVAAGAGAATDPTALTAALQSDPANPGYDAISLKALKADIVGASVGMPSLTSTVSRDNQGRATKIVTDPFTMTIGARDNPDGEQFAGALATMGYETLVFSGEGESRYDPDADLVTLVKGKNYWKLNDGFKLDFSGKYAGTKAIAAAQTQSLDANADPQAMIDAVLSSLVVHSFEFSLDDDGIVDRAFNAYAAQSGEDPAAVRQQVAGALAMAPMFAAGTGIDPPVITELATALSGFITAPKTLTISLAPKTPIKAQAFADAASDPAKKLTKDALGFAATNK